MTRVAINPQAGGAEDNEFFRIKPDDDMGATEWLLSAAEYETLLPKE